MDYQHPRVMRACLQVLLDCGLGTRWDGVDLNSGLQGHTVRPRMS